MTNHRDLFTALAAPFDPEQVKVRSQAGRQLSYITARTAMNRLDDVLGPENWWDDFVPGEHSVFCRLTIRLPDGQILTKGDAGGFAGMADPGDDDKSGYADAFKRAAVKFGIGRYLYRDGIPKFALETIQGIDRTHVAPQPTNGHAAPPQPQQGDDEPPAPRSGREFFARIKAADEEHDYGLLKHLNAWGKRHDFPTRMIDWEGENLLRGHAEACRVVRAKRRLEEHHEPMDVDEWERSGRREV